MAVLARPDDRGQGLGRAVAARAVARALANGLVLSGALDRPLPKPSPSPQGLLGSQFVLLPSMMGDSARFPFMRCPKSLFFNRNPSISTGGRPITPCVGCYRMPFRTAALNWYHRHARHVSGQGTQIRRVTCQQAD